MAAAADNVAKLKEAYAHWRDSKGHDAEHWMTLVADDIKFGSLAQGAPRVDFLRGYDNREALRGYFAAIVADWEMIHYSVDEFVSEGDRVVARGSMAWRNKKTGRVVESPKVDYWQFKDGKVVEFYEYYDTARVIAAASGDAAVQYAELLNTA